ncbi:MAG: hypothetical protein IJB83_02665 [Bacilli bacterium]|nr:hypothetical protein [Bacilli bacterium]
MNITIIIFIAGLIVFTSISNMICFFLGAKIRQKVDKGETLKLPTINPIEIYREHQERKEVDKEKEKLDIILSNIEKYDGTSKGQEDVPS